MPFVRGKLLRVPELPVLVWAISVEVSGVCYRDWVQYTW